jgi:Uma2 family endonuclease
MPTVQEDFVYYEPQSIDMPSRNHALVQSNLVVALSKFGDKYQVFSQLSIELYGVQYIPDLCLYSQQSYEKEFDEVVMTTPPIVVFEIVSPKQGTQELIEKFAIYFQSGVKSCWLIQPLIPIISVFENTKKSSTYSLGLIQDPATKIEINFEEVFKYLI